MPLSNQAIEASLSAAPDGLTIGELLNEHPEWARRTTSRWLAKLIEVGKVSVSGAGPSRRYAWAKPSPPPQTTLDKRADDLLQTPAAREVLAYVHRPIHRRIPVGYEGDFLLDYIPNQTFYLSKTHRVQLHNLGLTSDANRPAGTYGRAILHRLLIDLSWASSHLEGNTYTRLDTVALIEAGKVAEGRNAEETQMILNHKYAIEMLIEDAQEITFNRYTVMNLHGTLSENLLTNPSHEGRLRQSAVEITGSTYRPLDIPHQLEEYFDIFLDKASHIEDPFEQSFFAMVHLPYLQPFADANKRTSRLLANIPLIKTNLCPLTFKDVPVEAYSDAILGVYELTRVDALRELYLWAYERSTQEFLAIQRDTAKPDLIRLRYREVIKRTVATVVRSPEVDTLTMMSELIREEVSIEDQDSVQSAINDELGRLHEGVLARYGLRPAEFHRWKSQ